MTALDNLCADDSLSLQADRFNLHALHRQFAGIVQGLGVVGHLDVAPDLVEPLPETLMRDVVYAVAHDHAYRSIACTQQSPEILAGEVRSEGHAMRVAK